MANAAPQLHDMYEAYKRMYEAIRVPNIDEILKKPKEAPRIDPIDENVSVLYGKAIRAFPEQDHESHIAVHMQFMSDPSLAGNPGAKAMQPILVAHIAEHVALLYRSRMQSSIGVPLPDLPDIRDKEFQMEDIDPEMDMIISQRAAQVVQMAPKMQEIRSLVNLGQQGQQGNPLQYAQELAKLEAEAMKAKTEAEISSTQAKAQSDIQISQAKAQNDAQINQAKAQSSIEITQIKVQADLEAKVKKLEAELQIEREKAILESQGDIL
jgi:hypothetical protein